MGLSHAVRVKGLGRPAMPEVLPADAAGQPSDPPLLSPGDGPIRRRALGGSAAAPTNQAKSACVDWFHPRIFLFQ